MCQCRAQTTPRLGSEGKFTRSERGQRGVPHFPGATLQRACRLGLPACPLRRSVALPSRAHVGRAGALFTLLTWCRCRRRRRRRGWMGGRGQPVAPRRGDAAVATPTPAGRVSRPAREPKEEAAQPGPAVCGVEKPPPPPRPGLSEHRPTGSYPPQDPALRDVQETEAKISEEQQPSRRVLYSGTCGLRAPWFPTTLDTRSWAKGSGGSALTLSSLTRGFPRSFPGMSPSRAVQVLVSADRVPHPRTPFWESRLGLVGFVTPDPLNLPLMPSLV